MHKIRNALLGVATLGILTSAGLAFAESNQECEDVYHKCMQGRANPTEAYAEYCQRKGQACYNKKAENQVHNGPFQPGRSSSKPKPGAHRTVDGGTIMVTPEGQEWVWNGKYNTVIDPVPGKTGTITRSHSVLQGDPDAPIQKVGDKYISQGDPGYEAAVEAERVKKNVVVHDHRTPQPKTPPPAAGKPTKFGTAQGAASGQAASSAAAGSTATNTGGSYVRDHRQGANSATITPPGAAAGINNGVNKRPGTYAQ